MALNLFDVNVPPYRYILGCRAEVVEATVNTVVITPGVARDDLNQVNLTVENTITLDPTKNGANRLDTGTIAQSKMYCVFVIGDPSGHLPVAGLLSLSPTNPLMPAVNGITYGVKRLVGYVSTTAGTSPVTFTPCYVSGEGNHRNLIYDQEDSNNEVLNGSAATSPTNVALTTRVPQIQTGVSLPVVWITANISGSVGDRVLWASVNDGGIANSKLRSVCSVAQFQSFGVYPIPTFNSTGAGNPFICYEAIVSSTMTIVINVLGFQFDV